MTVAIGRFFQFAIRVPQGCYTVLTELTKTRIFVRTLEKIWVPKTRNPVNPKNLKNQLFQNFMETGCKTRIAAIALEVCALKQEISSKFVCKYFLPNPLSIPRMLTNPNDELHTIQYSSGIQ